VDENGYIEEVGVQKPGATLEVDAGIGASTLEVSDAYDFEETGGQLDLNGVVYTYVSYDDETSIIALSGTLSVAAAAGDRVLVYPHGEAMYAIVNLDDGEEPPRALIPFDARERFPQGIREEADMESVTISDDSGRWVVTHVDEEPLILDGTYIDPDTMPPATSVPVTVSPTPVVIGGIKVLNVQWPPTDGTDVTIQIHISETSGFTPVLDGPTLAGESQGTGFVVEQMPDGSPLVATYDHDADPDTGEIPKIYYVKLIAYNSAVPAGAAVSPQAEGSLRQIDTPDINTQAIWSGFMYADKLLSGDVDVTMDLTAGGEIAAHGASGEKVSLSGADGFQVIGPTSLGNPTYVHFPVDGRPNIIGGILNANTLMVEGDAVTGQAATFRRTSQIEPGAIFRLNDSIMPPVSAPVVENLVDRITNTATTIGAGDVHVGAGGWLSGEYYWTEHVVSPRANNVYKWNPGTNVVTLVKTGLIYGVRTDLFAQGLTRVSGANGWRVLWKEDGSTTPEVHVSKHDDATWVSTGGINVGTLITQHREAVTIGTDGTDVWVATLDYDVTASYSRARFRKYAAALSSGTPTETINGSGVQYDFNVGATTMRLRGLCVGTFDYPARRFTMMTGQKNYGTTVRTWDTGGTYAGTYDFYPMGTGKPSYISHDGTQFRDMAYISETSRYFHKYSNDKVSSLGQTLHTGYTFYTSTGPKETTLGPQTSPFINNRWKWKVTIATPPAGLAARIYMGTLTGSTNAKLQDTLSTGVTAHTDAGYDSAGAAPPATSTFGSTTPAQIESQEVFTVKIEGVATTSGSATITGTGKFRPWMVGEVFTSSNLDFIGATVVSVAADRNSMVVSENASSTASSLDLTFQNQPKVLLRGDGFARIYELDSLIISGNADVSNAADNLPPLRVGNIDGHHLRIDGNEILAMSDADSRQARVLGASDGSAGGVKLGEGEIVLGFSRGRKDTGTTDASSEVTFNHGLTNTPAGVFLQSFDSKQYTVMARTNVQVTVRARTAAGALTGNGVGVDFMWQCWE
jgi:hypothetical protein